MNCWGFSNSIFDILDESFRHNIAKGLEANPMKYEDLLPVAVCRAVEQGNAPCAWNPRTMHGSALRIKRISP